MHYLVLGAEVSEDGDIAIVNKAFTSEKELDRAQLVLMTAVAIAKDVAKERGIHEINPDSKNWTDREYIDFMESDCNVDLYIDRVFQSPSPINLQEVGNTLTYEQKIYQWASSHYLSEAVPNSFFKLTDKKQLDYLKENVWQFFEDCPAEDIHQNICSLSNDVIMKKVPQEDV